MEIVCLPPMKKFRPPIDLKAIEITTGSGTNAEAYTDLTRCDHILNERTVLATTKGIANDCHPENTIAYAREEFWSASCPYMYVVIDVLDLESFAF